MNTFSFSRGLRAILLATGIICGILHLRAANAKERMDSRPYLMFTVGDSISAGFIANTQASKSSDSKSLTGENGSQANGMDLLHQIGQAGNNKKTLSWSSGNEISSHFIRLQEYLRLKDPSQKLVVKNVAQSGALADFLPHETDAILKEWKKDKYKAIKYITLLIGANDACNQYFEGGTPDESFAQSLRNFLKTMASIKQNEPIHILVSSIPKIPDVAQPEIFTHEVAKNLTCQKVELEITHFCNPLLEWKTPEEYQDRVSRVERKNAILKKIVSEAKHLYPELEVAFSDSVYHQPISLNRLATDCFHPNRDGQSDLSELLWNDQPWFK